MKHIFTCSLVVVALIASTPVMAQDHSNHERGAVQEKGVGIHGNHNEHNHITNPASVMGAHLHDKGDWMLSYTYMHMEMDGMRNGTNDLSPEDIVGNPALYPNPNAGPAGFRVIPDEMSMDMHMLGGMYGATDWLTLMAMANYTKKEMNHITFAGGAGTARLGEFETKSSGWGDTQLGGLIKLYSDDMHIVHLNAMLSLPTGSIKEQDDVLAPSGATPTLRLPYAMQLGSGTYDVLPGITYTGTKGLWNWGGQYMATIRLENENSQDYALGDQHKLTSWAGYQLNNWLNVTGRITGESIGDIDGADALITAPVTTADPDNYGGEFVEASIGFNITPPKALKNAQIGAEFTAPIYQDLNGPQLKRDYGFTMGLRLSF